MLLKVEKQTSSCHNQNITQILKLTFYKSYIFFISVKCKKKVKLTPFLVISVAEQLGLSNTGSKSLKTGFLAVRPMLCCYRCDNQFQFTSAQQNTHTQTHTEI